MFDGDLLFPRLLQAHSHHDTDSASLHLAEHAGVVLEVGFAAYYQFCLGTHAMLVLMLCRYSCYADLPVMIGFKKMTSLPCTYRCFIWLLFLTCVYFYLFTYLLTCLPSYAGTTVSSSFFMYALSSYMTN